MKNQTPHELLKIDARYVAKLDTTDLKKEIDKRVRRVFNLLESDSDIVHEAAKEALDEYSEQQKELFKSKGLLPDRAYREAIVASDDGTRTIYRIVPRGMTLNNIDVEREENGRSFCGGYGSRMGIGREGRRGKYNDAGLIIDQQACSVDASEVVPFATM